VTVDEASCVFSYRKLVFFEYNDLFEPRLQVEVLGMYFAPFLSSKVVTAQRAVPTPDDKGGHRRNLATQPIETYPPSRASFA
jgi:hypothetical protein